LLKTHRKNVFNYAIGNENKDFTEFNVVFSGEWTAGYSAIEISEEYKKICGWGDGMIVTKISIPLKTLNNIIENEIPHIKQIDIMSIDIEGGELNCLYGIDLEKYKPRVMVIENVVGSKDICNYLESNNYILDKVISYNEYYIRKEKL
jgi:FkbM family methyltransferase